MSLDFTIVYGAFIMKLKIWNHFAVLEKVSLYEAFNMFPTIC
jgi:hypothetical protein